MIINNQKEQPNLKTSVTYKGNGTQKQFDFPFDYLRKAFVKVSVNGAIVDGYTIDNRSVIFNIAPASNDVIVIYRETSTERLVSWADASVLKAADMTISQVQQLHVIEEGRDWTTTNAMILNASSEWEGRNHKIANVLDPTAPQDVVTKHYMETVQDGFVQQNTAIKNEAAKQAQIATTKANEADKAMKAAKASADKAKASEVAAKNSEDAAKVSADKAKTSENNALTHETNAKASADKAKASETKVATSANEAKDAASQAKTSATDAQRAASQADTSAVQAGHAMSTATTKAKEANVSAANAKKSEELAKKYSDMAYDVVADANAIPYPTIDIIVGGGSVPDPSSDADNFVMSVVDNKGTLEVTKGNNKTTKIPFVKTVNRTAPTEGNVDVKGGGGGGLDAEFITNSDLDNMFN